MTKVGALVILRGCLSSICWLVRLVPVGVWVPWPRALFSWRRLLIWRECGLSLGVTQTVTEGGVRRHVLVCFILALFRSSDEKGAFRVWGVETDVQHELHKQHIDDLCCIFYI